MGLGRFYTLAFRFYIARSDDAGSEDPAYI
jgi:hypothetical protein